MPTTDSGISQPFWKDELDFYSVRPHTSRRSANLIVNMFGILIAIPALFAVGLLLGALSPLLAWASIISTIFMVALGYYQIRRRTRLIASIAEIQERARSQVAASHMGSAIHVAGHPLLTRDQPIVLALQGNALLFYSYENAKPIDSILVNQMQSIQTVVYDDERVPHIEVIDSAAQALQLVFTCDGKTWTCLLSRMRKVRAIDWYHAIQQARSTGS
jgi:hypothetical protein